MILIRKSIVVLSWIFLGSCVSLNIFTFKEPIPNNPFRDKLPSMEVVFASICKSGLKEYVIEDFSKNVLEKGDGSNGKIIVYISAEPNIRYSHFIGDYTFFIPFLPLAHLFSLPLYKVDEEQSFTALILNRKNDIVRRYTQKSSISFWTGMYNTKKNANKENQMLIDIFESLKANIKKDLPLIKKAL